MVTPENEIAERRVKVGVPVRVPTQPRNRLKQTLPTDRLSIGKQLDILRAYGTAFESSKAPVTNEAVGELVELAPTTVSLSNAFLVDVGLIQRADNGFTPSPEVLSFCHAHTWDDEMASHKLAPQLIKSWFAQALIPKLKFRTLRSDEALRILAEVSSADKDYTAQLLMLLAFLEVTGIVTVENGDIRLKRDGGESEIVIPPIGVSKPAPTADQVAEIPFRNIQQPSASSGISAGGINFEIKVNVNMAEISGWSADRITAFFSGVAQVLAAKSTVDKEKT